MPSSSQTFSAPPQPPSTVVPLIFFATELTWSARSEGRCCSVQLEVLAACRSRCLGFALLCCSVQNQVDEVIDVMQENITKVIERGERLDDLQDKSESLSDNATAFSNRAKQLRRQMWWRGCKMKAIIALVVVVLLLVIISE
uniref:Vesicle associated membrane protein 4 n=1 Tax=Anas zonorhyncha TaxID=75864 RepID=A0A8B9V1G2_9AVES